MKSVNNKIIVRVDLDQKNSMKIGEVVLSTAIKFDLNYREKSPVIAEVVSGNEWFKKRDLLIFHHNHFYSPSPYFLQDDLYAVPFNKTILAKINKDGTLSAVCGNILGQRISIENNLSIPIEHQKKYVDRLLVTDAGWTEYKKGQTVIHRLNAGYDIVYNLNGEEKRVTKLDSEQICGILRNQLTAV